VGWSRLPVRQSARRATHLGSPALIAPCRRDAAAVLAVALNQPGDPPLEIGSRVQLLIAETVPNRARARTGDETAAR
jgi:hypothetical protein